MSEICKLQFPDNAFFSMMMIFACFILLIIWLAKLKQKTYFYLLVIVGFYAIISFYRLGTTIFPITTWQPSSVNQEIIFTLPQNTHFDRIYTIFGEGDNNANEHNYQIGLHQMKLLGSDDGMIWHEISVLDGGAIYQYQIIHGEWNYKFVKLQPSSIDDTITEIAFKEFAKDEFLPISLVKDTEQNPIYSAQLLIDEQDKLTIYPSYFDEGFFDEVYHPRNAWEIANHQYMYASVHPLLGTSIMAISIRLLGMNPFAWRFPSALFGVMILPLFFLILKKLFDDDFISLIGTALVASDFMHLTTSRIGTLEPFSVFFILLMYYFMISYCKMSYQNTSFKSQAITLLYCGISMGIGISIKWTACYSAVGLAILFFTHFFREYFSQSKKIDSLKKHASLTIIVCIFSFVIVPTIIYFASYIPTRVWRDGYSIKNVLKQIEYMYRYHSTLTATHPYQSSWYKWLLDLRPVWYYGRATVRGGYQSIACFTNPLLSWPGLIAIAYNIYYFLKKPNKITFIILVGYLSALIPWMILVKRCVFSYHFYPTFFFMIVSICNLFRTTIFTKEKKYILGYTIACLILLLLFYPVLTGIETSTRYIKFLEWLPGWYFG